MQYFQDSRYWWNMGWRAPLSLQRLFPYFVVVVQMMLLAQCKEWKHSMKKLFVSSIVEIAHGFKVQNTYNFDFKLYKIKYYRIILILYKLYFINICYQKHIRIEDLSFKHKINIEHLLSISTNQFSLSLSLSREIEIIIDGWSTKKNL